MNRASKSCEIGLKGISFLEILRIYRVVFMHNRKGYGFWTSYLLRVAGGYSSMVLVGMCRHRIWKKTHTNTSFSRKSNPFIYQSAQILNKITNFFKNFLKFEPTFKYQLVQFWAKLPNFSKIFLNFKFGKFLKNQPIHIPDFAFCKGSFIYQEANFATHVSGTSP